MVLGILRSRSQALGVRTINCGFAGDMKMLSRVAKTISEAVALGTRYKDKDKDKDMGGACTLSTHSSTKYRGTGTICHCASSQFIVHLFAFRIHTYNIERLNEHSDSASADSASSFDCYKFQIDFCMALIALACPPKGLLLLVLFLVFLSVVRSP